MAQAKKPAPALAAVAVTEEIEKAQRVYADVHVDGKPARISDPDDPSRFYALQRETRADGSTGTLQLACGTRRKTGESVQRFELAEIERARALMLAGGLRLFAAE